MKYIRQTKVLDPSRDLGLPFPQLARFFVVVALRNPPALCFENVGRQTTFGWAGRTNPEKSLKSLRGQLPARNDREMMSPRLMLRGEQFFCIHSFLRRLSQS
jgi:hypothetical protein